MWRKLLNFIRRSRFEQLWFLPVWCLLGLSRAAILVLPFNRLAPYLGESRGVSVWVPLISPPQSHIAVSIRHVIVLAARYTPWQSNCFPQALVARLLLGWYRIPCSLFLGLARDEPDKGGGSMHAHAWVQSGPVIVTGGQRSQNFVAVGVFICS